MNSNDLHLQGRSNLQLSTRIVSVIKPSLLWVLILIPCLSVNAQLVPTLRISLLPAHGWGTRTQVGNSGGAIQPYGFGLGARLEYVFANGLSLGALFMAYSGESADIVSPDGMPLTLETRMQYGGLELAYEVPMSETYMIRPHVGFGVGKPGGNFSADPTGPGDVAAISVSGVRPYVDGGMGILIETDSIWFAGLDLRYIAIADYRHANAFSLQGTVGIRISTNQ